jgi:N-methylhydantoinase A
VGTRIAVDVGGTCTDLVVYGEDRMVVGKVLTTYDSPQVALWEALSDAAQQMGLAPKELLEQTDLFVYSTTRATNAIIEGTTSRTALLVTEGFPDVLVRKEGGRLRPYDYSTPFPKPYIPRSLTFEIRERISPEGDVLVALDENAVRSTLLEVERTGVEAVAIALLWSTANPRHEQVLAGLVADQLPEVAVSISHELNPIVREYRRASSVAIDASLKPLMQQHLRSVESWLREIGYENRLVAATSFGGVLFFDDLIERPIYSAKSGPSLAPMAGLAYAAAESGVRDLIVCDTGGTSFDVSLVRAGRPVFTRETWLGEPHVGHLTGLSSLDIRSVGAGGGSIAWIDDGGLLRVGPRSAGSQPGPACYGNGGTEPTVTDAAVVLGYIDPGSFLGGRVTLDVEAAEGAVGMLAEQLGVASERAAQAILVIAGERMADAIREITINEGIDPREAVIVAGGGAAGMTIVPIVEAIGCTRVLLPPTAGALSAAGAHFSDVIGEFSASFFTTESGFDATGVQDALATLERRASDFCDRLRGGGITGFSFEYLVEARYREQVWDLEIPFNPGDLATPGGPLGLRSLFDAEHLRIFTVTDPDQDVEFLNWKVRARGLLEKPSLDGPLAAPEPLPAGSRSAVFPGHGAIETPTVRGGDLAAGWSMSGPVLIQQPITTIVVPPGWHVRVTNQGSYLITKESDR